MKLVSDYTDRQLENLFSSRSAEVKKIKGLGTWVVSDERKRQLLASKYAPLVAQVSDEAWREFIRNFQGRDDGSHKVDNLAYLIKSTVLQKTLFSVISQSADLLSVFNKIDTNDAKFSIRSGNKYESIKRDLSYLKKVNARNSLVASGNRTKRRRRESTYPNVGGQSSRSRKAGPSLFSTRSRGYIVNNLYDGLPLLPESPVNFGDGLMVDFLNPQVSGIGESLIPDFSDPDDDSLDILGRDTVFQ